MACEQRRHILVFGTRPVPFPRSRSVPPFRENGSGGRVRGPFRPRSRSRSHPKIFGQNYKIGQGGPFTEEKLIKTEEKMGNIEVFSPT